MTVTDRIVGVGVGGIELAVTEAGAGGRPLVLVHGFTGARSDFEGAFDALADAGWHVVAPDLRGHGGSSKPTAEDAYALDLFATDVLDLVDVLGFDRFTVLGHSMGGMIVQELVLRAPSRIEALVLMDTSHGALELDPELVELGVAVVRSEGIDAVADVMATTDGPLMTEAYRRLVEDDPAHAERGDRNLRDSSPAMFAAMLCEIATQHDRLDRLAAIDRPALVIVGEQDEPFLDASRRMAETLPQGRLAIIPGGGHSPQFEAPDAWWQALAGFLAEVALLPA